MAKEEYSMRFKAQCMMTLAINRFDYKLTAEQMSVSQADLKRWNKEWDGNPDVPEMLERLIEKIITFVPADWKPRDWGIVMGILFDKWLLVHQMPTQLTENRLSLDDIAPDERADIIREAQRIIDDLGARGPSGGPS